MPDIKIVLVEIEKIKKAGYNPRLISKEQFEALVKSLREFGFVEPVVLNKRKEKELVMVGGHQRLEAAKRIGLKEVPAIIVSLSLEKEKLLNLALNRIKGDWNKEKLAVVISELSKKEEMDLSIAGFYPEEVDRLMKKMLDDTKPIAQDFDAQIRLASKVEKLLRAALVEGRGSIKGAYLYVIDPETMGIVLFEFIKDAENSVVKKIIEGVRKK